MRMQHSAPWRNQACLWKTFMTIDCQELLSSCSLCCLKDSVEFTIWSLEDTCSHLLPDLRVHNKCEDNGGYSASNQAWVPPDTRVSECMSVVSSFPLPQSGQAQSHARHGTTTHAPIHILPHLFPIDETGFSVVLKQKTHPLHCFKANS